MKNLRKEIFKRSKIQNIFQLHRNAFLGRDVFLVYFLLKKTPVAEKERESSYYRFTDAWPIHPRDKEYEFALSYLQKEHNKIEKSKLYSYQIPYALSYLRLKNPRIKREKLKGEFPSRSLLNQQDCTHPILCGNASLALFCSDLPMGKNILSSKTKLLEKKIDCLLVRRKKKGGVFLLQNFGNWLLLCKG